MSSLRLRFSVALLAGAAALVFVSRDASAPDRSLPASHPGARAQRAAHPVARVVDHAFHAPGSAPEFPDVTRERLAYSQAWDGPMPPALAAFRAWTERYRVATPVERLALENEGVALARGRRSAMHALIVNDPAHALAVTVPAGIRQLLPAAVQQQLETRHSGRGDFALLASQPEAGQPRTTPALRRVVFLEGQTFTAHPYGRRESQLTKEGASLHGIALDGDFALHESPVLLLDPGESDTLGADAFCAGCGQPIDISAGNAGQLPPGVDLVAAEGRIFPVHAADLVSFEKRALIAEDQPGPRVAPLTSSPTTPPTPPRAADAATAHTVGVKQVLVIRADFSDFSGEPMTQAAALTVLEGAVKAFFEDTSFNLTTINPTVSSQLYRLPRTGASYATANEQGPLHSDARALAAADYTLANYDRIIVLFPNIGTARVPGSRLTFAGSASVGGTNVWINGPNAFAAPTVSHELGHTYGLLHANLWRVNDRNPISTAATTVEYGDPFDTMGSTSVTGVTRDGRHHFNMWSKNRLGWLPDDAVATVTRSGTFRIHRFDTRNAPRTQPLALRIFRDGVRWYWVGLRQNFSTGTLRADGAYIVWGYNQRLQSQLLDLNTPGISANDAALPLGATFTDPASGISIRPVARGGESPSEWLDVEITVPAMPPNVVTAWGREGSTFYDTESGANLVPAPETNVPFSLTGVQAIAAGDQHALALKTDGTVVAWGDHINGQIAVPADLRDVVSIAAGGDVSGAVLRDGSVRVWGDATNGLTTLPSGLNNVKQLAIGVTHALALRSDGTVVAWGNNSANQLNVPATLANVAGIAAGDRMSIAVRTDGAVIRWGANFNGVAFPAGLTGVSQIAAHFQHALALKTDGTVVAWGNNLNNQSDVPPGLSGVVAIAAGGFHSLALKNDGTVIGWGSATGGKINTPRAMPRATAIACSQQVSLAITGTSLRVLAQPQPQTVALGSSTTLGVDATSSGPLTYQWRKDGVAIAGATGSTYTISGASAAHSGLYDVLITDAGVAFPSAAARVTATELADVSRIANLSIRTTAGTGAQTLIVGFVVGGPGTNGSKPLLVRGVGPTLSSFGVDGALADPKVEVYNASSVRLFDNDNWNASDSSIFASVGAFALASGSRDAALYNNAIPSGSYSAQLSGAGTSTGIVLAEIYDATASTAFTAATPRLVNVSARTFSGTGTDVLIAGFVVAGSSAKNVLIRAIGPSLTQFGVGGVLADPRLDLFNTTSARIQENDNWGGAPSLVSAFGAVGAFPLANDTRDAALLATLQPGNYTVQVSGVGNTTGVALVEIYEAP